MASETLLRKHMASETLLRNRERDVFYLSFFGTARADNNKGSQEYRSLRAQWCAAEAEAQRRAEQAGLGDVIAALETAQGGVCDVASRVDEVVGVDTHGNESWCATCAQIDEDGQVVGCVRRELLRCCRALERCGIAQERGTGTKRTNGDDPRSFGLQFLEGRWCFCAVARETEEAHVSTAYAALLVRLLVCLVGGQVRRQLEAGIMWEEHSGKERGILYTWPAVQLGKNPMNSAHTDNDAAMDVCCASGSGGKAAHHHVPVALVVPVYAEAEAGVTA